MGLQPPASILLIALLAGATLCGCDKRPQARSLSVVCSANTDGWITPCGCAANQSGGLLRRGTFLRESRARRETLYVDSGGAPAGASTYDILKFRAILRGEKEMGVLAHNIGIAEAMLGPEELLKAFAEEHVQFVSANLTDSRGQRVAPISTMVAGPEGRVLVTGVVSAAFKDPRWRVADPRTSVLNAIRSSPDKYDTVIVLAYAPEEELIELARALPEVDVVLGGQTEQSIPPRHVGNVLLASPAAKGKFIISLDAEVDAANRWSWSGTVVELSQRVADDPAQKANLDRYLADLATRNLRPEDTSFIPAMAANWPADDRFADSASCAPCHPDDTKVFAHHKHTFAYNDLVDRKMHVDPYCIRCHTTGYGLSGGFATSRSTPTMANVTCQACHGPSQRHVQDPRQKTLYRAKDQCHNCHDRENSPKFVYDTYWAEIRHGQTKAVVPASLAAEVHP